MTTRKLIPLLIATLCSSGAFGATEEQAERGGWLRRHLHGKGQLRGLAGIYSQRGQN